MMSIKIFFLSTAIASSLMLASCSKDDDNDNNTNVVSKQGLAVSPAQEVPPVVSPSSATGSLNVSYDKTTKMLTYDVTWSGLSDSITASHIHGTAAKGAAAGIKVGFTIPNRGALSGSYSGTTLVDGVLIKEDSLLKGFYYVNIHTKKNPAGEIRGQIEF